VGFVAAVLTDWRENDLADVLGVASGAAAPPGQAEFSILSPRQAKADMKVAVGERNDAQLLFVAAAPMVARQVIAAIRNRLTFIAHISFQSGMTSAMAGSGPIAVRSMPMLRRRFQFERKGSPPVSVIAWRDRGDN
jgi:hypothetical protein